jgi:peptide/nickel transport system permease protein
VWNSTLVLGTAFGIQNSRIIRSVVLDLQEHIYIESARAIGAGHARITLVHLLPNVLPTIIVVATATLPDLGRHAIARRPRPHVPAPLFAIWPATALSLAVFGFNMLGDALRDLLDPRLRGR